MKLKRNLRKKDLSRLGVVRYEDLPVAEQPQAAAFWRALAMPNVTVPELRSIFGDHVTRLAAVLHTRSIFLPRHDKREIQADVYIPWPFYHHHELPLHRACGNHRLSFPVLDYLVTSFPEACQVPTSDGKLPLHVACGAGAPLSVIQILCEAYPTALTMRTRKNGWLPVHFAISARRRKVPKQFEWSDDIIQYLVERNPRTAGPSAMVDYHTHWSTWFGSEPRHAWELAQFYIPHATDILEYLESQYKEQVEAFVPPWETKRNKEIQKRVERWNRKEKIQRLDNDWERFVAISRGIGDDLDCMYCHIQRSLDIFARWIYIQLANRKFI